MPSVKRKTNSKQNAISIKKYFTGKGYKSIKLQKLISGHLMLKAYINKIPGFFILDTGAGWTVIDKQFSDLFQLDFVVDTITGAGAGGSGLTVFSSHDNEIRLNKVKLKSFTVSAMNLEHVSAGLKQLGVTDTIHGVIGADVLERTKGVIDYTTRKLFMKN